MLCVLTGEDWIKSGWGDLPVPGTHKRRDGSTNYKPRYPALVKDRVRFVGDYVAFVVAETKNQAMDACRADRGRLRGAAGHDRAPPTPPSPARPLVWEDCKDNICFTAIHGDKAKTEEAFANAAHVVKEHLVINRVTTASMEPRGSVGDYNAIDDSYTIYTTLQRAHPYRAELAKLVLKVPEHKVRVVAPDIGGSFGMKSAIYNEVPLVSAGVEEDRPAGEMDEHALGGVPVRRAWRATTSPTPSSRSTRTAPSSASASRRSSTPAPICNPASRPTPAISARWPASIGRRRCTWSRRRCSPTPSRCRPYRGNGRPEAAYVIERMVDVAAAQLKMDPAELRRKNYIPPEAMPFKTSLTFTYDCGEFEKGMDMALKMADWDGFAKRKAESKKNGKLRGLGMSNTIERAAAASLEGAEIRFDRGGTVQIFSGSINQGQGHETTFKQVVADKLGIHPERHRVHPGRHRQGVLRRRHRRLALGHHVGLGVPSRPAKRSSPRPRRSPRTTSRSMSPTSTSRKASSPAPRPTRP